MLDETQTAEVDTKEGEPPATEQQETGTETAETPEDKAKLLAEEDDGDEGPYAPKGLPEHLQGESDRDTIDKLAKAYNGLRAKAKEQGKDPRPESAKDYQIEPELAKQISDAEDLADDPFYAAAAEAAFQAGLGGKQFAGFLAQFFETANAAGLMLQETVNPRDELKALGDGDIARGRQLAQDVSTWGKKLHQDGVLSAADLEAFNQLGGTAARERVLHRLMQLSGHKPTIPTRGTEAKQGITERELKERVKDKRYGKDEAFTNETTRLFDQFYGN